MKVLLRNGTFNENHGNKWAIITDANISLEDYIKILATTLSVSASNNRFLFTMEKCREWGRFEFRDNYEVVDYAISVFPDRTISIRKHGETKDLYKGLPADFKLNVEVFPGNIAQFQYNGANKNPGFRTVLIKWVDSNSFEGFDLSDFVGQKYRKFKFDRIQGEIKLVSWQTV